jgi:hypothetical protein
MPPTAKAPKRPQMAVKGRLIKVTAKKSSTGLLGVRTMAGGRPGKTARASALGVWAEAMAFKAAVVPVVGWELAVPIEAGAVTGIGAAVSAQARALTPGCASRATQTQAQTLFLTIC